LAGYRVYYREEGQEYDFDFPDWENAETTCTIYGLIEGITYYFVSRAYDIYGNESENSIELNNAGVASTTDLCVGDFLFDGDVDSSDLAELIANPALLDLSTFAAQFGRTDCP